MLKTFKNVGSFLSSMYAVLRDPQSSPYLGYELVLWTSADSPVKIVDALAQHKCSSKYSVYIVLNIFINILWRDAVF